MRDEIFESMDEVVDSIEERELTPQQYFENKKKRGIL